MYLLTLWHMSHSWPETRAKEWGRASTGHAGPFQAAPDSLQSSVAALMELRVQETKAESRRTRTGQKRREATPGRAHECGAERAGGPSALVE